MIRRAPCSLLLLAALAPAQERESTFARRSLAEGLVRQQVEIERLEPPRCERVLGMAAGDGPLVLLVRRRDGRLEVHGIQRGAGDHGTTPAAVRLDSAPEPVVGPAAAKGAGANAGPTEHPTEHATEEAAKDATGGERPATAPAPVERAAVRITRAADGLRIGCDGGPSRLVAEPPDGPALRALLDASFAATKGTPRQGELVVAAPPEVPFQDVLTVVAVARAAGFDAVFFDGAAARNALPDAQQARVLGIPAEFGWTVERRGPGGVQPIADGELLVLVDGPAIWGDVAPLHLLCARAGIWRISFVGRSDRSTYGKLPVNLPFDRGL